jgi:hypothetical protein
MMLNRWISGARRFEGMCHLHLQEPNLHRPWNLEEKVDTILRNVGNHLTVLPVLTSQNTDILNTTTEITWIMAWWGFVKNVAVIEHTHHQMWTLSDWAPLLERLIQHIACCSYRIYFILRKYCSDKTRNTEEFSGFIKVPLDWINGLSSPLVFTTLPLLEI